MTPGSHSRTLSLVLPLSLTLALLSAAAQAGQTITWTGSADNASWHKAGNWDLGRVPASGDAVVIPDVGGTTEVNYSTGTTQVSSVETAEPLRLSGGTLALDATLAATKDVTLSGGTLTSARFTSSNDSQLVLSTSGGTLDGVTLAADLEGTVGYCWIQNGLALDGGNVFLGTRSAYEYGYLIFTGAQTIGGSGEIVLSRDPAHYYSPYLYLYGNGKITIGPNIVVRGEGYIQLYGGSPTLTNEGAIRAEVAGKSLNLGTSLTWNNTGTLEASNGSVLNLAGNWDNTGGDIHVDGSTLNLGGVFTRDGLGTVLNENGGTVNLTGKMTIDAGDTFTFTNNTGSWNLVGGTVIGGRLDGQNGKRLEFTSSAGVLDGVTLALDLEIEAGYAWVQNGLTLDAATVTLGTRSAYEYGYLIFSGAQTVGGTGTFVLSHDPAHYYWPLLYLYGNGQTTIGPNVTIRGEGSVQLYGGSQTLANQGLIQADVSGKKFEIGSGVSWTNTGTLEAINGSILTLLGNWNNAGGDIHVDASTLNLGGIFTFDGLGTLLNENGGIVNLTGKLTMDAGDTLNFTGNSGSWNLLGGTIVGGRLDGQNGKRLEFTTAGGTLDGVTLALDLDAKVGYAWILNGLTLDAATIALGTRSAYEYGYLIFNGVQTIGGTGTFVLSHDPAHYYWPLLYLYGNGKITFGPNVTIRGEGSVQVYGGSPTMANEGVIRADVPDKKLDVGANLTWTNTGLLEAVNGGVLSVLGSWNSAGGDIHVDDSTVNLGGLFTFDGLGTLLNENGGIFNLTGKFTLDTGDTFTFTNNTGSWNLVGGTIVNGRLDGQNGKRLEFTTAGGTLDGVTLALDLDAKVGYAWILNGLTLDAATVALGTRSAYEYGYLIFNGAQTISGSGAFVLSHDPAHYYWPLLYLYGNGKITFGPNVTIRGEGSVQVYGGSPTMANEGVIRADVSDKKLEVGANLTWTSTGLLEAINGGVLGVLGSWNGAGGDIHVDDSTVNLGGLFTFDGLGTLLNENGGIVNLTGKFTLDTGDTFTFTNNTGSWNLVGGTIVNGRLDGQNGKRLEFTTTGGTLNGVTLALDLEAKVGYAWIQNGLTLEDATVALGTRSAYEYGYLIFNGAQTITGPGEFILSHDPAHYYWPYLYLYGSGQITFGPDVSIRGEGYVQTYGGSPTMANQGLICADVSGKKLEVGTSLTWSNTGTLEARGTAELRTAGNWKNEGLLFLDVGSKVSATSGFTQTAAGTLRFRTKGTGTSDFGKIAVTGTATLDGTLSLRTAAGYTPSVGHKFGFLTCTTRSGTFPIEDFLDGSGTCHEFRTNYSGTGAEVETLAADNTDTDGDGVCDASDNCRNMANSDQNDGDGDGIGDVCDNDDQGGDFDRGDSNCDGGVDFNDIDCFVSSLIGEESWNNCGHETGCDYADVNDINQDGSVDFDDIDPFVDCLINGGCE